MGAWERASAGDRHACALPRQPAWPMGVLCSTTDVNGRNVVFFCLPVLLVLCPVLPSADPANWQAKSGSGWTQLSGRVTVARIPLHSVFCCVSCMRHEGQRTATYTTAPRC